MDKLQRFGRAIVAAFLAVLPFLMAVLPVGPRRRASMGLDVAFGFVAYIIASIVSAVVVTPYVGGFAAYFGWLGFFGSFIFGALVSFPILVLTLWIFHKANLDAVIPEAS